MDLADDPGKILEPESAIDLLANSSSFNLSSVDVNNDDEATFMFHNSVARKVIVSAVSVISTALFAFLAAR